MNSSQPIAHEELTRQELLRLWFLRNGKPLKKLAEFCSVSCTSAGQWVRAERLPVTRVQQMRKFGIPEDLLPRAENISPGPQPKRAGQVQPLS